MKNTHNMIRICSMGLFALSLAPSVFAVNGVKVPESLKTEKQQMRVEERKMDVRMGNDATSPGDIKAVMQERIGAIKNFFGARVSIANATITGKGTDSITIEKDGKTYTVTFNGTTRLERRFYGKSSIDEFAVSQKVNVIGKFTDDAHTAILASVIRNLSIRKRFGAFVGVVTAVNGNDITINTVHRGTQKATIDAKTKLVNRKQQGITLTDIAVGHRIRVKGMWDSAGTITDVTEIKDYSLPARLTPTPTLTGKPSPTATPTATLKATPTTTPTATPTPTTY